VAGDQHLITNISKDDEMSLATWHWKRQDISASFAMEEMQTPSLCKDEMEIPFLRQLSIAYI
jgi:hypothetical protein